jgi:hypothetical protein
VLRLRPSPEPIVTGGESAAPAREAAPAAPRPRRRRRRRAAPAAAAPPQNGAAAAEARPERRPRRGPFGRDRRPRDREAREGAPSDRRQMRRAPGDTTRPDRPNRDRGDRRGPRDRAPGRGRDPRREKREQKLYALESVVDRGFEDVAADGDDGETRRVPWTIVKRTVADQKTGKPTSASYVLRRDGGETQFPNLGAARAAVNKTIVHPEKLTRSKEEYAAERTERKK